MLEHNGYYITVYTDMSLFEKWNLLNVSYLDYPCIIYWTRIHEFLSKIRHKQVDPFFDRLYISIHLEKLYRWTFRGKKKRKKKKNLRIRNSTTRSRFFRVFSFFELKEWKKLGRWRVALEQSSLSLYDDFFKRFSFFSSLSFPVTIFFFLVITRNKPSISMIFFNY